MNPPASHAVKNLVAEPAFSAMTAGERKMPAPTTIATATITTYSALTWRFGAASRSSEAGAEPTADEASVETDGREDVIGEVAEVVDVVARPVRVFV